MLRTLTGADGAARTLVRAILNFRRRCVVEGAVSSGREVRFGGGSFYADPGGWGGLPRLLLKHNHGSLDIFQSSTAHIVCREVTVGLAKVYPKPGFGGECGAGGRQSMDFR